MLLEAAALSCTAPPESTTILQCHLTEAPAAPFHLVLPEGSAVGAPVLVTIHGISRNARAHAEAFAPLARQLGVVVVAPLFEAARFPDYQRLGRRGERADRALRQIIDAVGRGTGAASGRVHLFGFSGGAQFAHRFAFAWPERVASLALGAAGWYTFPDDARFPRGLRVGKRHADLRLRPEDFLTIPTLVMVGKRDRRDDTALRQTPRVAAQQGSNRLERGRRWLAAMETAARARGLATPYRFLALPRTRHSFDQAVTRGGLVEAVAAWIRTAPPN